MLSYSLIVAGCLLWGNDGTTVEFPYEAYVVQEGAQVRAGPGQAYPETRRLGFGFRVQVYRHDPGGWCAVRPPGGSFSWVPGEAVELLPNGLGRITANGVPSYLGEPGNPDASVTHVRLLEGELVEILDVRQIHQSDAQGKDGGESAADSQGASQNTSGWRVWYKIAPPSGEFRWIHCSYLRALGSAQRIPAISLESDRIGVALASGRNVQPPTSQNAQHAGWQSAELAGDAYAATAEAVDGNPSISPADAETASRIASNAEDPPHAELTAGSDDFQPSLSPDTAFDPDIADLELELSLILSQEPTLWNLDDLERRVRRMAESGETAGDRAQARAIANKIRKAQEIARQQNGWQHGSTPAPEDSPRLLATGDARPLATATAARSDRYSQAITSPQDQEVASALAMTASQTDTPGREELARQIATLRRQRFDAVGRLIRVESRRLGSPRYALVNENGETTAYVSPVPGVKMNYYLGHTIGVIGTRSLWSAKQLPYIFARHVTPVQITTTENANGTVARSRNDPQAALR